MSRSQMKRLAVQRKSDFEKAKDEAVPRRVEKSVGWDQIIKEPLWLQGADFGYDYHQAELFEVQKTHTEYVALTNEQLAVKDKEIHSLTLALKSIRNHMEQITNHPELSAVWLIANKALAKSDELEGKSE